MQKTTSLAIGVALLTVLPQISAQSSDVDCMPSYTWAYNQKNQSPCVVASYLEGVCNGNGWSVPALPPGDLYLGPTEAQAQQCECNTVVYSLISACGACQNASFIGWTEWTDNCTSQSPSSGYPETIPAGTEVPGWAYLALDNDYWNATAAQEDLSAPASTAGSTPSASAISPPSNSIISSSSTSTSTKSSKSDVGAIAGGVVGGVVGIAIITAVTVVILRRRNRGTKQPSNQEKASWYNRPPSDYRAVNNASRQRDTKLYDPNDPTTFPRSPEPSVVYTTHTTYTAPLSPTSGAHTSISRSGQYNGVPEV
ncbi:hypothetical protein BJ138DRAFT_1111200 [Hygrophoropsis aurantiaca]|uniref:Uncharacterized protein n=1 Tax=Hygrophoropsis aurantiaca TaxID=72124 RepID=A0ACB8AK58_9AGAM|nr:hypothetical protein BJ138DRAFT_1111200 [Hygrophoropsis aurantiaca]